MSAGTRETEGQSLAAPRHLCSDVEEAEPETLAPAGKECAMLREHPHRARDLAGELPTPVAAEVLRRRVNAAEVLLQLADGLLGRTTSRSVAVSDRRDCAQGPATEVVEAELIARLLLLVVHESRTVGPREETASLDKLAAVGLALSDLDRHPRRRRLACQSEDRGTGLLVLSVGDRERRAVSAGRVDDRSRVLRREDSHPELAGSAPKIWDCRHTLVDEARELLSRAGASAAGADGEQVAGLAYRADERGHLDVALVGEVGTVLGRIVHGDAVDRDDAWPWIDPHCPGSVEHGRVHCLGLRDLAEASADNVAELRRCGRSRAVEAKGPRTNNSRVSRPERLPFPASSGCSRAGSSHADPKAQGYLTGEKQSVQDEVTARDLDLGDGLIASASGLVTAANRTQGPAVGSTKRPRRSSKSRQSRIPVRSSSFAATSRCRTQHLGLAITPSSTSDGGAVCCAGQLLPALAIAWPPVQDYLG